MDWWSLFRKFRKVIFAFIALASLAWAIVLSLYLSKQWNDFNTLQRAIVISLISVNGVTALLLYLMIVVVFRMWMELLRMVFLLLIHVGSAVPFTLYGVRFSCRIFDTQHTCKIVDLAFLATAWSITGLLLGYTIYLCIMSRIPRPFPLIIPNDLLTGSTPSVSRNPSMTSVNSKSVLMTRNNSLSDGRSPSPVSSRSVYSQQSITSRTVPKRMFVTNNTTQSQPKDALARMHREQQAKRGESYGAMGSPQHPRQAVEPVLQSRFSGSTMASSTRSLDSPPPKIASPVQSSVTSTLSRQSSAAAARITPPPQRQPQNVPRAPPRPLLLNPNPFMEPLSRHGTPETARSGLSFNSAPGNLNLGHMAAYTPFGTPYGGYFGPYSMMFAGVPPQLQPGARPGATQGNPFAGYHPAGIPPYMMAMGPHVSYSASPVGVPPRMHSSTPSNASIHSMAPSLHFADEHARPVPPQSQVQGSTSGNTRLPQSAHLRLASDPIWRPYSAVAHLGGPYYSDVELPNPYNRGAEIRRYGSAPHGRTYSDGYAGYGNGYGYAAGYTGQGARMHERGMARGLAAANDPRWREMVMRAAATR